MRVTKCLLSIPTSLEFDTSCFTGEYVTGERIGDEYFQRIHDLRNDSAQEMRRNGKVVKVDAPQATEVSDNGCESVHNDQSNEAEDAKKGCEAI